MSGDSVNISRGLLVAILVVAVLNLVLAAVQTGIALRTPPVVAAESGETSTARRWSPAETDALAARVIEPFNRGDLNALYELFDPLARNQFSREDFEKQFKPLSELIGQIDSASFAGSQTLQNQGSLDVYQLNYVVRLSGGQVPTGAMNINVVDRDGQLGIVGVFINGRTGR